MTENDLDRFIGKIGQLNKMIQSLEDFPERRELLSACEDHNQVVELAKSWGYQIGERWGENYVKNLPFKDNLLGKSIPPEGEEEKYILHEGSGWRLELITSCASSSKKGFWYDQKEHEWILILRGSAILSIKDQTSSFSLNVGDHLYLRKHRLHRVERTDPAPGTIWLALFWK